MDDKTGSSEWTAAGAWESPPPKGSPRRPERKSAAAAAFLSLMPGIGQIYCGFYQRGFVHITVVATLIALLSGDIGPLGPLFGLFLTFFWIYNVIDAARCAQAVNRVLDGGEAQPLPELPVGLGRASTSTGIVLIVVGLLLLAHIHLDWSFQWLADWWPLGLVALGLDMIRRARAD